jgi:hypothetical protein
MRSTPPHPHGTGLAAIRDVDEGLARTVEWYLANPDWWQALLARKGVGERLGTRCRMIRPVFGQTGQVARELALLAPDAVFLGRAQADLADPDACAAAIRAPPKRRDQCRRLYRRRPRRERGGAGHHDQRPCPRCHGAGL